MEKIVQKTIEKHGLLTPGDGVVVGLSGGADSTALLLILAELSSVLRLRLHAVHINHMFRGDEALRDEQFSVDLCKRLGIPITAYRIDVARLAQARGISFETAGREVRYEHFEKQRTALGFEKIAVAHHQDDQAETLFLRLIRGSGLEGLAGIRPSRIDSSGATIIRPLLYCSRRQIEAYCEEKGVQPMVDHTNADTAYSRNFIRNEVIPKIDQHFGVTLNQQLGKTAAMLAEDSDYIQTQVDLLWEAQAKPIQGGWQLPKSAVLGAHGAIKSRLIRKLYQSAAGNLKDLQLAHVEQIVDMMASEQRKVFVFRGVCFLSEQNWLSAAFCGEDSRAVAEAETPPVLIVEAVSRDTQLNGSDLTIYVDRDSLAGELTLRHRRPGDRFVPLGMKGHKKLKDFLIDEKIPFDQRDRIWLLCDEEKILWVCGIRQSEDCRVTKNTGQILRLSLSAVVTQDQM